MALPGNTQLNCKVDKRSIQKLAQQQLCWLFWNNQTQSKLGLARVLAEKWEGCPPTPKSNSGLKAAVKLHLKGLMPSAEDRKLTLLGIAMDIHRLWAVGCCYGKYWKCSIRDFEILCSTKYPFPTSYQQFCHFAHCLLKHQFDHQLATKCWFWVSCHPNLAKVCHW